MSLKDTSFGSKSIRTNSTAGTFDQNKTHRNTNKNNEYE